MLKNADTTFDIAAYDITTGEYATGLLSAWTLAIYTDATLSTVTRTPIEIAAGKYRFTLSAAETNGLHVSIRLTPPVDANVSPIDWHAYTTPTVTEIQSGLAKSTELSANQTALLAKLPTTGRAAADGAAMTLTVAYDAAKNAASASELAKLTSTLTADTANGGYLKLATADIQDIIATQTTTFLSVLTPATAPATGYETLAIQPTLSSVSGTVNDFMGAWPRVIVDGIPTAELETLATSQAVANVHTSINSLAIPTVAQVQNGLAKTTEVNAARDNIKAEGNANWKTATIPTDYAKPGDTIQTTLGTLATSTALSAVAGNVTSVLGKLPATGTVPNTTTAMTLTGDYDKAKTAASAAEVWNNTTRTLTSATAPTATENAAAVWAATTRTLTTNFPTVPTVSQITTGVWDAASRSLTTPFPTVPSSTDNANAVITAFGSNADYADLLRDVTKMVGQFPDSGTLATIGAAMTLTPAYDAAKTAAQAASLTALASTVTAVKAKTDLIDGTPATVEDLPSPTDLTPVQNQIAALSTLVNNGVVAKLPASGTVPNTATPMTLAAAYDRAKDAASSTEVAAAANAAANTVTVHGGAGPWTSASATSGVTVEQLQTELAALEAHGDETWSTATGFATPENILASQQAIIAHGDANWIGGGGEGGGATPAQIAGAVWNYTEGDGRTISGQNDLATADGLSGVQEAIIVHGDRYWMAGGNEPDPPAADAYASVNDLYLRWGYINIRAWADIDNDRDAGKIMARILWALQSATAAMNKVIERSNYKCPLERVDASYPLVPQTERNICAGMAGEILFKGRQIAATNDSPTIERAVEDFNNWSNDILNGGFIAGVKGKND